METRWIILDVVLVYVIALVTFLIMKNQKYKGIRFLDGKEIDDEGDSI